MTPTTARKPITRLLSTTLALALATPTVALAETRTDKTEAEADAKTTPQAAVEVDVTLGASDDDIIAERLTGEVGDVLTGKGVAVTETYDQSKVAITVKWNADDNHEIAVKVTNRGKPTTQVEGSPFVCDACSENELVAKIREVAPKAVPLLATGGETGDPAGNGNENGNGNETNGDDGRTDKPGKIGALGGAGIGLMVLGAGAIAGGAALTAMGQKQEGGDDPQQRDQTDFRPPGIAVLAAGSVVLIAGIGMLIGDRLAARRKKVSVVPAASPTFTGLTIQGRF